MSRWSHSAISLIFIVLGSVPTGSTAFPPALINVDVRLFSPALFLDPRAGFLSCFQACTPSFTCHGGCLWLYTHAQSHTRLKFNLTRTPLRAPCVWAQTLLLKKKNNWKSFSPVVQTDNLHSRHLHFYLYPQSAAQHWATSSLSCLFKLYCISLDCDFK